MHLPGLLGGGIVESQVMEQAMGDVQRQFRVGAVAPAGRLPCGQLAVDDQIENPRLLGIRLIRQVKAQAIRGPLMIQEPHVKLGNLGIIDNSNADNDLPDLKTRTNRSHELSELRYVSGGLSKMSCDPDRNHARDAHVSTILGTPGFEVRSGRGAGASGAVG